MSRVPPEPEWLEFHRQDTGFYAYDGEIDSGIPSENQYDRLDRGFSSHSNNGGDHVSPYDEGRIEWGMDSLTVKLIQGIDEASLKNVLSRSLRATTGIHPGEATDEDSDAEEMFKGGLQASLESQVVVFEITGASRALTHQLVRTRKAAFHQQSQRATWYGDRPNVRFPESIHASNAHWSLDVEEAWREALRAAWKAYRVACDAGVAYEEARYILPEGTTNYILCEYSVREFMNVYAYRACSMFMQEMWTVMRAMGQALIEAHPFMEPHIKISCEKPVGPCEECDGSGQVTIAVGPQSGRVIPCSSCPGDGKARRCTFQGWENVENACNFPWARQDNRVFLPAPRYRIGG